MTGTDKRHEKRDGRRATGWSDYQLSMVLGVSRPTMSRWRGGLLYPDIRTIKKIEKVFGWKAAEQIELIPIAGYDSRWSIVFNAVLVEWIEATPRDLPADDIRQATETRTRRLNPSRPVGNRSGRPPNPPLPPLKNV